MSRERWTADAQGDSGAGAATSAGFPVMDAIGIVVVALVVVLGLVMLAWRFRQPARPQGVPWYASRTRRIQQAAAEDVEAIRGDARRVSPDAPGNYPDEL